MKVEFGIKSVFQGEVTYVILNLWIRNPLVVRLNQDSGACCGAPERALRA